jgi:hypothetical protein
MLLFSPGAGIVSKIISTKDEHAGQATNNF